MARRSAFAASLLAALLSLGGLVLSGSLMVCLVAPGSPAASVLGPLFSDPDVPAAAYQRNMREAAVEEGAARAQRLKAAQTDALTEITAEPLKADAWLRLAYVRAVEGGVLTGAAAQALRGSYRAAPWDPAIAPSRIRVALEGWRDLPPDLRSAALGEMQIVWADEPSQRETLGAVVGRLRSPEGHAAGEAILARLRSGA